MFSHDQILFFVRRLVVLLVVCFGIPAATLFGELDRTIAKPSLSARLYGLTPVPRVRIPPAIPATYSRAQAPKLT